MLKQTGLFLVASVLTAAIPAVAQQYGPPPPPPGQGAWQYNNNPRWTPEWDRLPNPDAGACFYTDRGFTGHRFCVRAGDRLPALPGDFGDNISSIQVYGGARVRVFDDRNFRGVSGRIPGDVADLRELPSKPGHTWNNRISSIMVR